MRTLKGLLLMLSAHRSLRAQWERALGDPRHRWQFFGSPFCCYKANIGLRLYIGLDKASRG